MERNENFKIGLVLDQINRKGSALFSFLIVTLVHFGASRSIFNVLSQCRKIFNLIDSQQASGFCFCETSQRLEWWVILVMHIVTGPSENF